MYHIYKGPRCFAFIELCKHLDEAKRISFWATTVQPMKVFMCRIVMELHGCVLQMHFQHHPVSAVARAS